MTYQGDGSESGYVDPKRDCPHFEANFTIPIGGEVIDAQSRCQVCEEPEENWLCLKCYGVGCGRWKKAHGLAHYEQSGHCVAFSYADFTAWCYGCDSYVTNPILQLIQTRAYRSKFGKEAATKPSYGHASPEEIEEYSEEPEVLKEKVKQLAALIRSSSYTVAYTGAGVSTAASIPDYRGPKGVWTMADKGESVECPALDKTTPTATHMALVQLFRSGLVRFLTSTNLDGLHRRSGFTRDNLAELHGNSYIEACPSCKIEHLRQKPVASGVDHATLNKCENCGSRLVDNVINFGENLPEAELSKAIGHAEQSDLSLVLGTSMRVSPANKLPLAPIKSERGNLVIVNLQKTPFDNKAKLVIHARTDEVMTLLMEELQLPVPVYKRGEDAVLGRN